MNEKANMEFAKLCTRPPEGWWCARPAGHDGPCAALPEKWNEQAQFRQRKRDNLDLLKLILTGVSLGLLSGVLAWNFDIGITAYLAGVAGGCFGYLLGRDRGSWGDDE